MIPNITRGGRFIGLLAYLQGEGRANEHTDPHVVAGMRGLDLPAGLLSASDVRSLADQLDEPRVAFGVSVAHLNKAAARAAIESGVASNVAVADATHDSHVWHCSLSLSAQEKPLSDEKWAQIARDFMAEMGIDDDADDTTSPARWVAVRHGLSKNGNDHIHIAASVVRDDGTKVHTFKDFQRAQEVSRMLEHKYGLNLVQSRDRSMGDRGLSAAESARQASTAATGAEVESPRHNIERRIRAAACGSVTEAEFVRRCRADGLRIRPYFEKGSRTAVSGYSVLVPVQSDKRGGGGKAFWCGGGKLAKDLTLPRLRDEWEQSPQARAEAAREWANTTGNPVTQRGARETTMLDPAAMSVAARQVGEWNAYLASIPLDDHAQWARAASRSAAMFAAWSTRLAPNEKAFREAARMLRSAAATQSHTRFRADVAKPPMSGTGIGSILLQASLHDPTAAWTLLLDQLMRTARAVAAAQRAAGDAVLAHEMEQMVASRLQRVHAAYPPLTAEARAIVNAEYGRMTYRPASAEEIADIRAKGRELAADIDDSAPHSHGHEMER